ncbi:glycosyltransferase family 2 protein [Mucisphaera sp.]|uniref:glycosyltransferase family 2 protein n=1 Tax=Mucisphaera sp. TaxID=2913024 RepID=UPI003D11D078
MQDPDAAIDLSIVAPAHNEQDNVDGLVDEVAAALRPTGLRFELILIDDGSTDATVERVRQRMAAGCDWLSVHRLVTPAGRGLGPAAGYRAGILKARGELIAIIDADRQNDPNDLPVMVHALREQDIDLVQGDRSANRRDTFVRRVSSAVGRGFRRAILGDDIRDSACAIRVMRREMALALPFEMRGMQRFTAYVARMMGYAVIQVPVNHRPRVAGKAKFGVWNRALPGLIDLIGVRWMKSRWQQIRTQEEPVSRAGSL